MLNICILNIEVSDDPELQVYGEHNPVTSFTLAFKSYQKNWIKVFCPGQLGAKANKYLEKGDQVVIMGFLHRDVDLAEDEQLCLVADELEFFRGVSFSHKA
jgi:single-strand DNA-binding protein